MMLRRTCILTVDFGVVGAAVEEDTRGLSTTVAYSVIVDLDVVASLGCDDT